MVEKRKSSAMIPVIIAGACLFGFGIYQSTRPLEPEVNTGFVAPPQTPNPPETPTPSSGNPRTMQAPGAPAMEKDAAQRAAESDTITMSDVKADKIEVKVSPTPAPWLQAIMSNTTGNFRHGVLASLKGEQAKGSLNCAPVLTDTAQSAFAGIEKIACTARDGGQIDGEFADSGDGDLKVEYPDGSVVKVTKNDGDFNVETRISK